MSSPPQSSLMGQVLRGLFLFGILAGIVSMNNQRHTPCSPSSREEVSRGPVPEQSKSSESKDYSVDMPSPPVGRNGNPFRQRPSTEVTPAPRDGNNDKVITELREDGIPTQLNQPSSPTADPESGNYILPYPKRVEGKIVEGTKIVFYSQVTFKVAFFCDMISSCIWSGVPIHVEHWGAGRVSFRKFNARLQWAYDFLTRHVEDDNTLVVSMDAADSFIQETNVDGLVQKIEQVLAKKKSRIIFSGEVDCFVVTLPNNGCGHEAFTKGRAGDEKYINTGLWVGYAGDLKRMFKKSLELVPTFNKKAGHQNDQAVIGYMYAKLGQGIPDAETGKRLMAIDDDNELFQSFCKKERKEMMGLGPGKGLWNKAYNSSSPIVHSNGPGKQIYVSQRPNFWWSDREPPLNSLISVNGKLTPFKEICPVSVQDKDYDDVEKKLWKRENTFAV